MGHADYVGYGVWLSDLPVISGAKCRDTVRHGGFDLRDCVDWPGAPTLVLAESKSSLSMIPSSSAYGRRLAAAASAAAAVY